MDLASRGVTVYCSASKVAPVYERAAAELGRGLARAGATLVYGGGAVGLMGVLADAALAAGGRVVGVIPRRLIEKEVGHPGASELIVVTSMHERKSIMSQRASAYVVLPGGYGTYEEFLETVTWRQLGIHFLPIVLINVEGFFNPLLAQIERAVADGMIKPEGRGYFIVAPSADAALAALAAAPEPPPGQDGWT